MELVMQYGWIIGIGIALAVLLLLRAKLKAASPSGRAAAELKRLTEAYNGHADSPQDLPSWKEALSVMERYPSDYNKLNGEISFVQAFVAYLEKHYPEDAGLQSLRQHAHYRKDSIWGITVKRD
ncbi:hypothetical protein ACFFK0_14900 [Paenibacillus chartarius]|uniref:Uncharacterized protein n=1 Tax=Paenibacillus chartarius TaxID=747481 RepID=A0ABV6DM61_9BACL